MARAIINILGISEIKWTGMGEFNWDDNYIYYCGQESLGRNRVAIIVSKSLKCSTWIQRLIEFCQENALVIANTLFQQLKRRLYTLSSPGGQHQNQTDYILCNQRWRSSIESAETRPGADCGSDHDLLIAKFRLTLKKVGKTTRPFSYDLHQILNDYIMKVRNRFKRLDLIDRVPDELWLEVCDIVQETRSKTMPKKRNEKRQNGCLRRPYK